MAIHLTHFDKTSRVDLGVANMTSRAEMQNDDFYRQTLKPLLDKFIVILAMPLVLPVILLLVLLAALDGGKPLYSQLRVGKGGKSFRLWKIRTMVADADSKLESHLAQNAAARLEWDTTQKLKTDPRITPVGRVLRKTSLDELPQLFNVLNGSMSLVGPRPMMVDQKSLYKGHAYFRMAPGITGLWQVSDRNDCGFADRVRYDDVYEENLSLPVDMQILYKTVGVVLRGTGC